MPAADLRASRLVPRRAAVSRAQVETVAGRALGAFGLVFGAQTVPTAIDEARLMVDGAGVAMMAVVYGAIAALAAATFTRVAVRAAALAFAAIYVIALLAWPFLVVDTTSMAGRTPWLYYLCTVATTAAVIALPVVPAAAYTIAVPAVYGVVRLSPSGGGAGALLSVLDTMYAVILGVVVLVIITMLRQAAIAVDAAQEAALERYDAVARRHAIEIERVKVDALVHDSVLTTLLSAAASRTPAERALAARMATDAVRRLDEAAVEVPGVDDRVALTVLTRRLRGGVAGFSAPFIVRVEGADGVELPVEAIDALSSAAMQAMVNSVQHADGPIGRVRRELEVRGVGAGGCVIRVIDNGSGFDPAAVPPSRLGLRVSIEERMANEGGSARVASAPGEGTTVTLAWPAGVQGSEG
ncbi:sensor histidine kinase [Agromyces kandeliae]|uniref:ATP-binding protein n=1 Tax=Agromyces kandeliae TaxID=2666141 RepID=A0A6L5QYP5_9MICO|nr:ATP-binding protein [Agromyces kandeliae]MRX42926.1 ATP-binding protein [Agromyces kandeliae]